MTRFWQLIPILLLFRILIFVHGSDDDDADDNDRFSCTFDDVNPKHRKTDHKFCSGMKQSKSDDFNWKVKCENKKPQSFETVPHSGFKSWCVMYIDVYEPMYRTRLITKVKKLDTYQTARISLPAVTEDGKYTLKFVYHMNGKDIGALKVHERLSGSKKLGDELWKVEGSQNKLRQWKHLELDVDFDEGQQIVIEGITSDTCCSGTIVVDNIEFVKYVESGKDDDDEDTIADEVADVESGKDDDDSIADEVADVESDKDDDDEDTIADEDRKAEQRKIVKARLLNLANKRQQDKFEKTTKIEGKTLQGRSKKTRKMNRYSLRNRVKKMREKNRGR